MLQYFHTQWTSPCSRIYRVDYCVVCAFCRPDMTNVGLIAQALKQEAAALAVSRVFQQIQDAQPSEGATAAAAAGGPSAAASAMAAVPGSSAGPAAAAVVPTAAAPSGAPIAVQTELLSPDQLQ